MSLVPDLEVLRAGLGSTAPERLLFVTISGSHLYGFPSVDSDVDLRGAFVEPLGSVLSLVPHRETVEGQTTIDGLLIETVTHEVAKYFRLLAKGNGYVVEQVLSPHVVVHGGEPFERLRELAPSFLTRDTVRRHYTGFTRSQLALLRRRPDKQVKIVLYALRVVLSGIFAMRTGMVEANLRVLNDTFRLSYIDDLIAQKVEREEGTLSGERPLQFYLAEVDRLFGELEDAALESPLPDRPRDGAFEELDRLLLRVRSGPAIVARV
jgi:predicted nucleotidyltransferase